MSSTEPDRTMIVVYLLSPRWDLDLCSVRRVGLRNGELKHCAAHSGKLARVNEDHACRIYNQRVIPRGLVQDPRAPIDKVSSFTPRCNTTELLPSSRCESGTYHAFLLACPQGARKEDCWVDVAGTKEKPIGVWTISPLTRTFSVGYYTGTILGDVTRTRSARSSVYCARYSEARAESEI
ncbi:hypothetical protein EDB89DRAFT_1960599 [Lactarius sanguifluus]|nr:hypothetical protein EDB89DRAFT_1960599 [Lactarius sanguifluus]